MNLLQIDTLNAMQNAAAQAVEPEPINLWTMAQYGGVIMIVLAILLAWAIYLFVERLVVLHKAQKEDRSFMDRIKDYIHEGKRNRALYYFIPLGISASITGERRLVESRCGTVVRKLCKGGCREFFRPL